MLSKIVFIISIIFVLFIHFTILSTQKQKEEKVVVSKPTSISKISLQKVVLKKKELKKQEKKKEPKKLVKPKPIKKEIKKIVKKDKNKVLKKQEEKKIVKKPKPLKKEEKIVKKEEFKPAPSVTKKVSKVVPKKELVSNETKNFIENEYISALRKEIEKNKVYPKRAKRLKQEGRVVISFELLKDGTIKKINIKDSSGFKRLNSAAVDLLETISKFQPIPKELNKDIWVIEIPINYSIYNS